MEDGAGSDETGDEEAVSEEGYETDDGRFVIFDSENPLAWIISDVFGVPPDRQERDEGADGEESGPEE